MNEEELLNSVEDESESAIEQLIADAHEVQEMTKTNAWRLYRRYVLAEVDHLKSVIYTQTDPNLVYGSAKQVSGMLFAIEDAVRALVSPE